MSGEPIIFTPATPFFAAAVALIHERCFSEPWPEAAVREILAMPGVFGLIGGGKEDAAGFVICRLAADECEIISIGVAPERRRVGIATALLGAAIARAHGLGAKSAFLEVAADNPAAEALYRRHGFAEAGRRQDYYRRRQGRVDALILAKKL
jgi:ribosomal-protein-alanine N-acetyltransferase